MPGPTISVNATGFTDIKGASDKGIVIQDDNQIQISDAYLSVS